MKKILYTILQLTWGFPQTLAGFIIFLKTVTARIKISMEQSVLHGS